MSLGLFLTLLLQELGSWGHWLLLLKGKINVSVKKCSQDSMHEPAASRGPRFSSSRIGRMLQIALEEKAVTWNVHG